ncbi:hypothetical protein CBR_g31245 [Chara braunii]|uniref:Uncharacterized protein n=1 Tax=Chara braunii TaxID=69332 RepID=A0A388JXS0_CHABU|nr:hypothetical protein CBR_g31245 [Chara braunii]|eukprot:GBG62609.1 hypothetical protein CBR_g31245 [Chara braunii]
MHSSHLAWSVTLARRTCQKKSLHILQKTWIDAQQTPSLESRLRTLRKTSFFVANTDGSRMRFLISKFGPVSSDDNGLSWYCCGGVEKSKAGRFTYDGRKFRTFFLTSVYDREGKNWVKEDKKASLDHRLFQGYGVKALSMKAFDVCGNGTEFQMLDPKKFLSKTNGYRVTDSVPVVDSAFMLSKPLVQFNSPTVQLAAFVMRYREEFARLPAAQQVDRVFVPIDAPSSLAAGPKRRQDQSARAGGKRKQLPTAPFSSAAVVLPAPVPPSDRQGRDAAELSSEAIDYDDGAVHYRAGPQHPSRGGAGASDDEECKGQDGEGGGWVGEGGGEEGEGGGEEEEGGGEGDDGNEGDVEGEDDGMDEKRDDVGEEVEDNRSSQFHRRHHNESQGRCEDDACRVGDAVDAGGQPAASRGMSQSDDQTKDGRDEPGSRGKRKRGEASTSPASRTKQARADAVNEARGALTASQEARTPRKTAGGGRSGSRGSGRGGGRKGSQRSRAPELRDSGDEGEGVGPRMPEDIEELVQHAAPGRRITPDEFFQRDSAEFDWYAVCGQHTAEAMKRLVGKDSPAVKVYGLRTYSKVDMTCCEREVALLLLMSGKVVATKVRVTPPRVNTECLLDIMRKERYMVRMFNYVVFRAEGRAGDEWNDDFFMSYKDLEERYASNGLCADEWEKQREKLHSNLVKTIPQRLGGVEEARQGDESAAYSIWEREPGKLRKLCGSFVGEAEGVFLLDRAHTGLVWKLLLAGNNVIVCDDAAKDIAYLTKFVDLLVKDGRFECRLEKPRATHRTNRDMYHKLAPKRLKVWEYLFRDAPDGHLDGGYIYRKAKVTETLKHYHGALTGAFETFVARCEILRFDLHKDKLTFKDYADLAKSGEGFNPVDSEEDSSDSDFEIEKDTNATRWCGKSAAMEHSVKGYGPGQSEGCSNLPPANSVASGVDRVVYTPVEDDEDDDLDIPAQPTKLAPGDPIPPRFCADANNVYFLDDKYACTNEDKWGHDIIWHDGIFEPCIQGGEWKMAVKYVSKGWRPFPRMVERAAALESMDVDSREDAAPVPEAATGNTMGEQREDGGTTFGVKPPLPEAGNMPAGKNTIGAISVATGDTSQGEKVSLDKPADAGATYGSLLAIGAALAGTSEMVSESTAGMGVTGMSLHPPTCTSKGDAHYTTTPQGGVTGDDGNGGNAGGSPRSRNIEDMTTDDEDGVEGEKGMSDPTRAENEG